MRSNQPNPDLYHDENLWETLDSFIATNHNLVDTLVDKTRSLPPVRKDGTSECSFAEDLYAEQVELTEKAVRAHNVARGYQPAVEGEIAKHLKNNEILRRGVGGLQTPGLRSHLSRAESEARSRLERLRKQQTGLAGLIKRMDEAIQFAQSKKFPVRKPRRSYPGVGAIATPLPGPLAAPPPGQPPGPKPGPKPGAPGVSRPLSGLLSSGPLDTIKK